MRYYFISIREAIILKNHRNKNRKISSVAEDVDKFCVLLVEMWNSVATVENTLVIPLKVKHRITIWFSNSTSRYLHKRIDSRDSTKCLYTSVLSSTIHNSQKVETTQMFTDRWRDKQNDIYLQWNIIQPLKNEILMHAIT